MTVQNETATHGVKMTEAASAKAKALFDQEGRDDLALRIAVQGFSIDNPNATGSCACGDSFN
jgi:Fe-S cluster assembly iron-binding protein IscA